MTTLPMMLIGMVGILLVIGVIVLAVMLLNRLTSRKDRKSVVEGKSVDLGGRRIIKKKKEYRQKVHMH